MRQKDIKMIHKRYGELDTEKKGHVSVNDIIKIPEIEANPLRYRIGEYLAKNMENETVSFTAFVRLIDIFKNNKVEEQYKCMKL